MIIATNKSEVTMTEAAKMKLKSITEDTLMPVSLVLAGFGLFFWIGASYFENKGAISTDIKFIAMNDVRQDAKIEKQELQIQDYMKNQTILMTEIRDRLTRLELTKNK